jgi:type II secretory pathway pseudopilin PulG
MRFPISNFQFPISRRTGNSPASRRLQIGNWQLAIGNAAAFTMIEIAICLAIIGFALVAIIGVLPLGMNTQRDNREETVINQDATVLLGVIRNAARGADYLTNYVYAVTNYWTFYNADGTVNSSGTSGYNISTATVNPAIIYPKGPYSSAPITNAANIVGLMSTPEFISDNAAKGFPVVPTLFNTAGYSNHVTAYVRSVSGLASDRPPQDNPLMLGDSFGYRVFCVNAPMPVDTNSFNLPLVQRLYATQLAANQRELRLTFLWPQLPNGNVGNGRQTFRTTVAGQLGGVEYNNYPNQWLYFYQPQFTNAP